MPDAIARLLQRMIDEGCVPRSRFSARAIKALQSLFDAGAISQSKSGGGLIVKVRDPQTVLAFYRTRYPSAAESIDGPPRARAVGMLRNAKRVGRTNMEPVLLRAMQSAVCTRAGVQCDLRTATVQTGAACLILQPGQFWSLTAQVAVVENLECFLHFERMHVVADVAMYASGRLSELVFAWFSSPELAKCRFVHCGDYDPVGLDEFLRLKTAVGDRASLHVPNHLPELVSKYGRQDLLKNSAAILQRLRKSSDNSVRTVVDILDNTGCGMEQEALLLAHA